MAFDRLNPHRTNAVIGSVATDGSTYFPIMNMPAAGEVVRVLFVNATTSSATSGTTAGSSITVNLYKNASATASVIATFNGSGTAVATLGTATLITSGTAGTTNGRFASGDALIGEVVGGVANDGSQAGAFIQVEYIYGRANQIQPSAASGPA